ncbi:Ig-like domain-containing protein [Vulgatibacter incomptus]|uniref:SbsA Ig-like domain-containing protein n=1 Tax=Vulgatibacter incomptus TaxID=1391653 RepID=A0A0K1PED0_9BACT|nr:Ig-like domain-containing protein [Vulgatibacter incomptus]AKU91761.1 hypothetical protein AKJ08_2148 [Vulgatibacter incomptus]
MRLTVDLAPDGDGAFHANGKVGFSVEVEGSPDSVELLGNGKPLLSADPSRPFDWDTTADAEGVYTVQAVARRDGLWAASERLKVVVDRTPPTALLRSPAPGAVVAEGFTVEVVFSEPVLPPTIDGASVRLTAGGTEVPASRMLSFDGKLLSIGSSARLEGTVEIALELSDRISDLAGNALSPVRWTWISPPDRVELKVLGATSSFVYANRLVEFQLSYTGSPDELALVRSGSLWQELSGDSFTWDVTDVPDGEFKISGMATYGGRQVLSDPITVRVDHQRPTATPTSPLEVWPTGPSTLRIDFSKDILPASITEASVRTESERGSSIRATASLEWNRTTMTVSIEGVEVADRLTLHLTDSITDKAGNPLVPATFQFVASAWNTVGGRLVAQDKRGFGSTITARSGGRPIVAWTERVGRASSTGVVRMRQWSGSSWTPMPEPTGARSFEPVLASTSDHRPVVAWTERSDQIGLGSQLYVSTWDGSSWQPLGDSSLNIDPGFDAKEPALALDDSDRPVVAWRQQVNGSPSGFGDTHVFVKRWTGSEWEQLGTSALATDGSSISVSVAVDAEGSPVVAWSQGGLQVRRWDGEAWVPVGSGPSAPNASLPKLVTDPAGGLVLAWIESGTGWTSLIQARRWNGSEWNLLGDGPVNVAGRSWIGTLSLALDPAGKPILAWGENRGHTGYLYLARWDGSTWTDVGTEGYTYGELWQGLSLAMDGERPLVALGLGDGTILVRSPVR